MPMMAVMIGVDPHKGSHTAVVMGPAEQPLAELRVRASKTQADELVAWAAAWPERTWAVEGARGLGRLLAQQLVAAGEQVLDVQPKLASRVRPLQAGDTNKNDPNDALSVAVAALRSKACREVTADDHRAVLKVWSKRHRDLGRARNQAACRLHAVLCDLVAGGISKEISAGQAGRILAQVAPSGAAAMARAELAAEFLADLRHIDTQLLQTSKKLAAAVRASGTSLTQLFGVGPVIAGTVVGDVASVCRFPRRDHFAAYNGTAPVEVSSGNRKVHRLSLRGNRRINHAIHMAAITQIRHRHSEGRAYYEKKLAEGKTHKEALRSLKRQISDAIFARLQARGHWQQTAAQYRTALRAARAAGDRTGEAGMLDELGLLQQLTGDYADAIATLTQAIELFRELGDRSGQAYAVNHLGLVYGHTSDFQAAIDCHQQALELALAAGDELAEAVSLTDLGMVLLMTGDLPASIENYRRALPLFRSLGSKFDEADALTELGTALRLTGDYEAALAHEREGLALWRELGDRLGQAWALDELGMVHQQTGRYEAAAAYLEEALELHRDLGLRHGEIVALNDLGELAQRMSVPEKAGELHREALAKAIDLGAPAEQARSLAGLGRSQLGRAPADAAQNLREALAIYERIGAPDAREVRQTLDEHGF
jgi:transposase